MTDILNSVDLRTQLAGNNRMELLTFCLNGEQKYGINVFKVREVMFCPQVSEVKDEYLKGIVYLRGHSLAIVDLNKVIHGIETSADAPLLVITEFNESMQGFLVGSVDRIVNLEWKDIHPPPQNLALDSFVTATTEQSGELVQILDVEKVLDTIEPKTPVVDDVIAAQTRDAIVEDVDFEVVYCDDSAVARRNIEACLNQLQIPFRGFANGALALEYLKGASRNGMLERVVCVISDIEMPELDGFTLALTIKKDDRLKRLPIYLHSSLSGDLNETKALQVGADGFINKFHPNELARVIQTSLNDFQQRLEKVSANTG